MLDKNKTSNIPASLQKYLEEVAARPGLPALKPEAPWHGYDLGVWPPYLARQAEMATRSEYFEFSDELIKGRRSHVGMNDPVPREGQ